MFESLRTFLESATALAHSRLELLGNELRRELAHSGRTLVGALAALFFCVLGIVFAALTVMIIAWDEHRVAAAISLTVVFLGAGVLLGWRSARGSAVRAHPFRTSLAELDRDRAAVARSAANLAPAVQMAEGVAVAGRVMTAGLTLYWLVRQMVKQGPRK
jgi:uncharacterized membrane protein YqjE